MIPGDIQGLINGAMNQAFDKVKGMEQQSGLTWYVIEITEVKEIEGILNSRKATKYAQVFSVVNVPYLLYACNK